MHIHLCTPTQAKHGPRRRRRRRLTAPSQTSLPWCPAPPALPSSLPPVAWRADNIYLYCLHTEGKERPAAAVFPQSHFTLDPRPGPSAYHLKFSTFYRPFCVEIARSQLINTPLAGACMPGRGRGLRSVTFESLRLSHGCRQQVHLLFRLRADVRKAKSRTGYEQRA